MNGNVLHPEPRHAQRPRSGAPQRPRFADQNQAQREPAPRRDYDRPRAYDGDMQRSAPQRPAPVVRHRPARREVPALFGRGTSEGEDKSDK